MKNSSHALVACVAPLLVILHASPVAATEKSILINPGFEQALDPTDRNKGWQLSQHAGVPSYEMEIDKKIFSQGKQSFRITRILEQVYGQISQVLRIPTAVGKTLNFSAMLRGKDVGKEGWMLVVNFLDKEGYLVSQSRSNAIKGTTQWQRINIVEQIPARTFKISVGAMLLDAGTGWIDDATLSIAQAPPNTKPSGKIKDHVPVTRQTPVGKPNRP